MRNLLVHGPAFRAYDEVAAALRTTFVGLAMLVLPLIACFAGPVVLALWAALFAQAILAKLRFAQFARLHLGIKVSPSQILLTPLYVLSDFVAWSRPLLDLIVRPRRW